MSLELLIPLVKTVADASAELFRWQAAETQIRTRRLLYDIDQQQQKRGYDLRKEIDGARSVNDVARVSQLLDDSAQLALYLDGLRSAIPESSGPDLGEPGGVQTAPAPSGGPDPSLKPAPGTGPTVPVTPVPRVPYSVTGRATVFGLNYDGSDDRGDQDAQGRALKGAFGDETHNKEIVGVSLPIPVFESSIGRGKTSDVKAHRYTVDILSHVTGKHLVGAWIVDLGPSVFTGNALDLTYASACMLGHSDNGTVTYWIKGPEGQPLAVKGWDFRKGRALS
jgi:hypothetical protein